MCLDLPYIWYQCTYCTATIGSNHFKTIVKYRNWSPQNASSSNWSTSLYCNSGSLYFLSYLWFLNYFQLIANTQFMHTHGIVILLAQLLYYSQNCSKGINQLELWQYGAIDVWTWPPGGSFCVLTKMFLGQLVQFDGKKFYLTFVCVVHSTNQRTPNACQNSHQPVWSTK